jgi:hypothetical protein
VRVRSDERACDSIRRQCKRRVTSGACGARSMRAQIGRQGRERSRGERAYSCYIPPDLSGLSPLRHRLKQNGRKEQTTESRARREENERGNEKRRRKRTRGGNEKRRRKRTRGREKNETWDGCETIAPSARSLILHEQENDAGKASAGTNRDFNAPPRSGAAKEVRVHVTKRRMQ